MKLQWGGCKMMKKLTIRLPEGTIEKLDRYALHCVRTRNNLAVYFIIEGLSHWGKYKMDDLMEDFKPQKDK